MMMIAPSAASAPGGVAENGVPRMMAAVAKPATSDAAAYLQTAPIRDETPNPIGRPAYQKAGIERIPKDTLQAAAMPAGPHGNARTNNKAVAADSTSVQRSQRPGFPIERWIQPTVP